MFFFTFKLTWTKFNKMEGDFTLKLLVIEQKEDGGSIGSYVTIGWAKDRAQIWRILTRYAEIDLEFGEHQVMIESNVMDKVSSTNYRVTVQHVPLGKTVIISKFEQVAHWLVRVPQKINLEEGA